MLSDDTDHNICVAQSLIRSKGDVVEFRRLAPPYRYPARSESHGSGAGILMRMQGMNALTVVLMGFAALAAAIALVFAVAAVVVQWRDRPGRKRDVVFELWLYATVFCALFLVTAIRGGLDAKYGDGWEIFVWALPCVLIVCWLAGKSIKWLRKRFSPEVELEHEALFAELEQSHTRFAQASHGQSRSFDRIVEQGGEAFRFAKAPKAQVVKTSTDRPGADHREARYPPPADALYFHRPSVCAQLGWSVTGLKWFRDLIDTADGMVLAVEARGIHVGAIGSIQAGTAFFPWAAMKSVVWAMPRVRGKEVTELGICVGMADKYRKHPCKLGYLLIPGPLRFEDRQGFIRAVCRFAPEDNPLRKYIENFFFRFCYLWLRRVLLAFVMVGFYRFVMA